MLWEDMDKTMNLTSKEIRIKWDDAYWEVIDEKPSFENDKNSRTHLIDLIYNILDEEGPCVDWEFVEKSGTSVNIASFVGATTIRLYVIGQEDRRATPKELKQMKELVRREMEAGALGIASSLVYTPAFYANTEELIELSKTAAEYGGIYISHIRGEGADLIEALEELR